MTVVAQGFSPAFVVQKQKWDMRGAIRAIARPMEAGSYCVLPCAFGLVPSAFGLLPSALFLLP
jgi:hypothetical protein